MTMNINLICLIVIIGITKLKLKKNLSENLKELTDWYKAEQKKYERAMWHFDDWYTEYSGGSWEENNIDEYKGG